MRKIVVLCGMIMALWSTPAWSYPDTYAPLGPGTVSFQAKQLSDGVVGITIETDLQDVVSLYLRQPNAGQELVRIATRPYAESATSTREALASLTIDQQLVYGRFQQRVRFDLDGVHRLELVAVQSDGVEYPIFINAQHYIGDSTITLTFPGVEGSRHCYPIHLDCAGGCPSRTKTCCNIPPEPCADCVDCILSCFSCPF